jgi:hypothetical protein
MRRKAVSDDDSSNELEESADRSGDTTSRLRPSETGANSETTETTTTTETSDTGKPHLTRNCTIYYIMIYQ